MIEDNKNNDTKEELKKSSDDNNMDIQEIDENKDLKNTEIDQKKEDSNDQLEEQREKEVKEQKAEEIIEKINMHNLLKKMIIAKKTDYQSNNQNYKSAKKDLCLEHIQM